MRRELKLLRDNHLKNTSLSLYRPQGLIVGGLDQGALTLYDASKLLSGDSRGAVVATKDKHTGPVQALDFNPFQVRVSSFWLVKVN